MSTSSHHESRVVRMPAISFQGEWLNKLLSGTKQQTTRQRTDRIKVGDVCHIYNQQRRQIRDKPLRRLTRDGIATMPMSRYPFPEQGQHYAHFLGKVKIVEVYDMLPLQNSNRSRWAKADGFDNFTAADTWFTERYGEEWAARWWTVIRWDSWLERYFESEAV